MRLDDPIMTDLKPEARDYFLACYAVSLFQGETILGTPIKHDTIKQYLKATQISDDFAPDRKSVV